MSEAPPRTTCDCAACRACCERQPGPLAPGDLGRISAHLRLTMPEALGLFRASPGAVVMDSRTGRVSRVGTIVPARTRPGGPCVFLSAAGRCRVHSVAPAGCALFDMHMDAATAQPRAAWLVRQQAGADYQRVRATLAPAGEGER